MIHAINLYRHEVWIFVLNGAYRRVILTELDKVEEVNSTGEPITEESNSKPEPIQEAPKISLQEVLSWLSHCLLYNLKEFLKDILVLKNALYLFFFWHLVHVGEQEIHASLPLCSWIVVFKNWVRH